MSRLQKVVEAGREPPEPAKAAKKIKEIPEYDISGKFFSPKKRRRRIRQAAVIAVVAGAVAFIYLPGAFMTDADAQQSAAAGLDTSAVTMNSQVLRNYPEEDFDGDGLTNAEETSYGTDPWRQDTDGDGATDFYETKVSDTDPVRANKNLLSDLQNKLDKANDTGLSTPYKINNVTLWPDDYQAKANGSVVETLKGYQFCNFSGYASFPDSVKYAYKVEGGTHEPLQYNSSQDAWYISGDCTVETYSEKLKEVVDLSFFSRHAYPDAGRVVNVLASVLPDKGFITAQSKMLIDVEPDTSGAVTATIQKPSYDSDDDARFMADTDSLSNLLYVMETIDNGSCVAVSLYKDGAGEYIGIVYGYDMDGNLYIADPDTLEPVGVIATKEATRKMIGQDEALAVVSWFEFSGLGFDSGEGNRISFFAATGSYNSGSNELIERIQSELLDEVASDAEAEEEGNALESEIEAMLEESEDAAAAENDAAQASGTDVLIEGAVMGGNDAAVSEDVAQGP